MTLWRFFAGQSHAFSHSRELWIKGPLEYRWEKVGKWVEEKWHTWASGSQAEYDALSPEGSGNSLYNSWPCRLPFRGADFFIRGKKTAPAHL